MGRKQKKPWKYILLFPALCLIVLNVLTGCQSSVKRPDLTAVQEPSAELSGTLSGQDPVTKPSQLEANLLDQADESMKNGDVAEALQSVSLAISCCEGFFSGRAFDIIGTALAHPNYKLDNYKYSARCLKRLKEESPKVGYGLHTGCWVAGLSEMLTMASENNRLKERIWNQKQKIKTLKKQIEQLKAVDLEPVQPE